MKTFKDFEIDLPSSFSGDRKTTCPKCSHTRKRSGEPCLSANAEKGTWNCHHCGWSGSLYDKDEYENPPPKTFKRPPVNSVPEHEQLSVDVARWFAARGISIGTLRALRIFSTQRYLVAIRKMSKVMAFPYFKGGELINVKYRDARKNMTQETNPEPCLYNIDNCAESDVIYICEGEIDVATMIECDYMSACSVDKGAPGAKDKTVDKKLECVDRCIDILKNASRVVLVSDKDEQGLRLEKEIIKRIGPERCFLVRYPSDCKDINDVLVRHGSDAVRESIESARPAPVPGLRDFSEFRDDIYRLYKHGNPRGLTTGWPGLDEIFTLQPGSLNIITGIPMSGKSEFVHALLVNAAKIHGWKTGLFSPEMLPPENLFQNFAEKIVGKSFFGKKETRMQETEVDRALSFISEHIKPLIPEEDKTPTLDGLIAAAGVCVARYDIRALVLDPYNEIEHTRPAWMSETEYISLFLGRLRTFARMNQVWVGIIAHPTKLKKDERTKEYPVPTPYDISGSANWRNKADNCLSLWRSFKNKNNVVELHVQKIKQKGIGKLGSQAFTWDYLTGLYEEVLLDEEAKVNNDLTKQRFSGYLPYSD